MSASSSCLLVYCTLIVRVVCLVIVLFAMLYCLVLAFFAITGLPRSGKTFWKMKYFPGQGKVREFHFQSVKFRKYEKSPGIVYRLLEI